MKTFVIFLLVILAFVGCAGVVSSVDNDGSSSANNELENIVVIPSQKAEVDFSKLSYCSYGDSITYGYTSAGRMPVPYPTAVSNELSLRSVTNKGRTAARLVETEGYGNITEIIEQDIPARDYDIISLLGGINDCASNNPLGTIDDFSNTTIYGSLNIIARTLTVRYPDAFIFFMTPLYKDMDLLPSIVNAVKEVAKKYNILVLDLYNLSGFDVYDVSHTDDRLHPTQKFVLESLAPQIAQFIRDNYNK